MLVLFMSLISQYFIENNEVFFFPRKLVLFIHFDTNDNEELSKIFNDSKQLLLFLY